MSHDIFVLAKNFGQSALNHLANGMKKVSDEIYNSRVEKCKTCEHYDASLHRCKNCGCFLKIKASWDSEKCPIDKW